MKFFYWSLFAFIFVCIAAQANPFLGKQFKVNPNQVVVTEEGIFAYLNDEEHLVVGKELSIDEHGNMLLKGIILAKGPCYIHDLWCRRCGGCGVILCPMNCSCFD